VIHHIDVSSVLRRTVCELYSNLVTRPTGVAVRTEIEMALARLPERSLTVIDFSHVGLLDFSCADEVVGKLLDNVQHDATHREAYFLVRGVGDSHVEAIETVLERYDVAVVIEESDGTARVVGPLEAGQRRCADVVYRRGRASTEEVATELGEPADTLVRALEELWERRLVMREADGYVALPSAM
jgi:hypothetical protein